MLATQTIIRGQTFQGLARLQSVIKRNVGAGCGFLIGVAAYLYLNLFTTSSTPYLLNGDQAYFWMDGLRISEGETIYKDFFRHTTPGTDLLFAALFRIFGPAIWVTNATVLALGLAFAIVCYFLSRRIMNRGLSLLGLPFS